MEINKLFDAITGGSPIVIDRQLKIWGRHLTVPESSGKVAKFTFTELCGHPLSAVDYLELTRAFNTIFLLDVPKMDLSQKDLVCEKQ
jgi:peroxisome-assembly ATPase